MHSETSKNQASTPASLESVKILKDWRQKAHSSSVSKSYFDTLYCIEYCLRLILLKSTNVAEILLVHMKSIDII